MLASKRFRYWESAGNHVIRYNGCWSDEDHYFNDGMGAGYNGGFRGFPGADSDIYGNYVANCWDDGIEAEGGTQNVRIWSNHVEEVVIPIANAATSIGPLYVWRNVCPSWVPNTGAPALRRPACADRTAFGL